MILRSTNYHEMIQKFKNKYLLLASKLPKPNLVLQEKLRDTGSGWQNHEHEEDIEIMNSKSQMGHEREARVTDMKQESWDRHLQEVGLH